jgi:hypothetical protein
MLQFKYAIISTGLIYFCFRRLKSSVVADISRSVLSKYLTSAIQEILLHPLAAPIGLVYSLIEIFSFDTHTMHSLHKKVGWHARSSFSVSLQMGISSASVQELLLIYFERPSQHSLI